MEGQLYNAILYKELEHLRFPYLWGFWNPFPAPPIDTKRWLYIILGMAEKTCAHVFTISPFPCFLFPFFPVKVSVQSQGLFYTRAKQSDACWGLGGGWRLLLLSLHMAVWVIEGLPDHEKGILRKGSLSDSLWGLIFPSYYRSIWLLLKKKWSLSVMSNSLRPYGLLPTRLLSPWGFSRQEYWSGLPFPSPGDLPDPRIEPGSPILQADSLPSEPQGNPDCW